LRASEWSYVFLVIARPTAEGALGTMEIPPHPIWSLLNDIVY
jgi:hypothetical protein